MQSFLELHRRPVVQFDPTNPEHRKQAAIFLREGTWSKSPWAFYAPENLSIKAYAMQSLVDYYVKREFAQDKVTKPVAKSRAVPKSAGGKLITIARGQS